MPKDVLYIKKPSGFSQEVNDTVIEPLFYQPTPEGADILCKHYSKKYGINLKYVDLRDRVEQADNSKELLRGFKNLHLLEQVETPTAFLLGHKQFHVIPLVALKVNGKLNMIIFDSTSGGRMRGYYQIANLFPDINVYLNNGTRQSDSSSCITDGICILKEALQLPNLYELVKAKLMPDHPVLEPRQNSRFHQLPRPSNFFIFSMPEQLLVTAQLSSYVTDAEADLNVKLRGGKTLAQYREQFKLQVSLFMGEIIEVKGINSYLFIKSREHKELLDKHLLLAAQEKETTVAPLQTSSQLMHDLQTEQDEQLKLSH